MWLFNLYDAGEMVEGSNERTLLAIAAAILIVLVGPPTFPQTQPRYHAYFSSKTFPSNTTPTSS